MEEQKETALEMREAALRVVRFCEADKLMIYTKDESFDTPIQAACERFKISYKEYIKKALYTYDGEEFKANAIAQSQVRCDRISERV